MKWIAPALVALGVLMPECAATAEPADCNRPALNDGGTQRRQPSVRGVPDPTDYVSATAT